MTKKYPPAIVAVVAILAFTVPSTAGAAKATCSSGVLCPTGTVVALTGTDLTFTTTGVGPITCATLNLNSTITVNNGTAVEASGNNVSPTQSDCTNGSNAFTFTEFNVTRLFTNDTTSNKVTSATISLNFKMFNGKATCNFTGATVPGTFNSGSDVLQFSQSAGITSENCGTTKLDGQFTLAKSGTTTAVIFD